MRGMDIADFLLARIAEDEAVARECSAGSDWRNRSSRTDWVVVDGPTSVVVAECRDPAWPAHIARWDPVRVLAECEAKRRIVERARMFTANPDDSGSDLILDDVLRDLALPYADHPDYDESWRP